MNQLYIVLKMNGAEVEIFTTSSTGAEFINTQVIENAKYQASGNGGYVWYINFVGNEVYWTSEPTHSGSTGSGWQDGNHSNYFIFEGQIYEYNKNRPYHSRIATISENGESLEQYMVNGDFSDWIRVNE